MMPAAESFPDSCAGDMTIANIVRLNVYTTDVDDLFKRWGVLKDRAGNAECHFATSVVGVTRLAAPQPSSGRSIG